MNKIEIVKEMVNNGYYLFDETIEHFAERFDENTLKNFAENFKKNKKNY